METHGARHRITEKRTGGAIEPAQLPYSSGTKVNRTTTPRGGGSIYAKEGGHDPRLAHVHTKSCSCGG